MVEHAPVVYQDGVGGRQAVPGRYELEGNSQVGFAVRAYDPTRPLVIDPVLSYSTYLGGSQDESTGGIAVDSAGNAYVEANTSSTNFPTTANALQPTKKGNPNVENLVVAKLNASGTALVYSTYLGGSQGDFGEGIAVGSAGNAYITGSTRSPDFPTVHPLQTARPGLGTQGLAAEAFVAEVSAGGTALVYSTYLGGSKDDEGNGIAVDGSGNAYVTGDTHSSDFPTTAGAFQTKFGGGSSSDNAFVTKVNAGGTALVYSTYLGGSGGDVGIGIAVDAAGNAYETGDTTSSDFPTTNTVQSTPGGGVFVAKLNASGTALAYSTRLGGSNNSDISYSIAVDGAGSAYVTGEVFSSNFPTVNALPASSGGSSGGAFVTKLNAGGTALVYSTRLGGSSGGDYGTGIAVDAAGNAYVVGSTTSTDFPTVHPVQATNAGHYDAFVTKIQTSLVVTNTNDSGPGSLRQAILDANANPGLDTITFDIPGTGVQTISPTSPLPSITDPVVIDGYTQPGASQNTNGPGLGDNAVLLIDLDGSRVGQVVGGLRIDAGASTVRGLAITGFGFGASGSAFLTGAILLHNQGGNVIEGNFLGTDATGKTAAGNLRGVMVLGGLEQHDRRDGRRGAQPHFRQQWYRRGYVRQRDGQRGGRELHRYRRHGHGQPGQRGRGRVHQRLAQQYHRRDPGRRGQPHLREQNPGRIHRRRRRGHGEPRSGQFHRDRCDGNSCPGESGRCEYLPERPGQHRRRYGGGDGQSHRRQHERWGCPRR